jgi:enoyl-CoA hydratase
VKNKQDKFEYKYLIVEKKNAVGIVTINKPQELNAASPAVIKEMLGALDDMENDGSLIAVVITGSGEKAFSVGADIGVIERIKPMMVAGNGGEEQSGPHLVSKIASCSKPTIAAVNGYALGGGFEICLACDIIIAAEHACFGLPEVRLGIIPGWGGTQRLSRLVGTKIAKEIIFSGTPIDAKRAYELRIVNKVVPYEDLFTTVIGIIAEIAKGDKFALQQAKKAIDRGIDMPLYCGLKYELECLSCCFFNDEPKRRARAFKNKKSKR